MLVVVFVSCSPIGAVPTPAAPAPSALMSAMSSGDAATDAPPLPLEDRVRLGGDQLFSPPTGFVIPIKAALDAARAEYDWTQMGAAAKADAFLETVRNATGRMGSPGDMRVVWIVRLSGVEQDVGGPGLPNGSILPGRTLRHAYIFIDAASGSFLSAAWTE